MDQRKGFALVNAFKAFDLAKFAGKVVDEWTPWYRERADRKRARRRALNLRRVATGGIRSTVGTGMSGAPSFMVANRPTSTPWKIAR